MLLVFHPNSDVDDPQQGIRLMQEATKLVPEKVSLWKILSQAHYRAGNWKASIDAMEKSVQHRSDRKLNQAERFVMAMARWRLGERDAALTLFNDTAAEMDKSKSQDEKSLLFRQGGGPLGPRRGVEAARRGDESRELKPETSSLSCWTATDASRATEPGTNQDLTTFGNPGCLGLRRRRGSPYFLADSFLQPRRSHRGPKTAPLAAQLVLSFSVSFTPRSEAFSFPPVLELMEERGPVVHLRCQYRQRPRSAGGLPAGQESLRQAIEDANADTGSRRGHDRLQYPRHGRADDSAALGTAGCDTPCRHRRLQPAGLEAERPGHRVTMQSYRSNLMAATPELRAGSGSPVGAARSWVLSSTASSPMGFT